MKAEIVTKRSIEDTEADAIMWMTAMDQQKIIIDQELYIVEVIDIDSSRVALLICNRNPTRRLHMSLFVAVC